jgi:hypothetical protein
MAWHVIRFQMEEQLPIWRVTVNIWNKQLQIANKECSSSMGLG